MHARTLSLTLDEMGLVSEEEEMSSDHLRFKASSIPLVVSGDSLNFLSLINADILDWVDHSHRYHVEKLWLLCIPMVLSSAVPKL